MPAEDPDRTGARALDPESRAWVDGLRSHGTATRDFTARLQGLLERAAHHEATRRSEFAVLPDVAVDQIAQPAAAAALSAIIADLDGYRGESRFTTWASKFAIIQVSASIGHALRGARTMPFDRANWNSLPDRLGLRPDKQADWGELLAALYRAVDATLSDQQRTAFVCIALSDVQADTLAAELGSDRNALYKALFEARRRLRGSLTADGYIGHPSFDAVASGPRWLDELLTADMGDAGCEFTLEVLDRYVEAQLSEQDTRLRFSGVTAHLRGCRACREDHAGLLIAAST
jgi:RNA polymerase sigma-70 factor, ECF subfamily